MPKVMPGRYKTTVNTFYGQGPGPSGVVPPKATRKRGRPRGNPTPLNEAQKKLRNAQYERERRNEAAEAMTDLQAAMGLEGRVSNNEIISTAIHRISKHNQNPPEDLNKLRSQNKSMEEEIAKLERILAGGAEDYDVDDNNDNDSDADDDEEEEEEQQEAEANEIQSTEEQQLDAAYCFINDNSLFDDNYFWNDTEAQLPIILGME